MANYRLSKQAISDIIGILEYSIQKFGMTQADNYFESFFEYFDLIAKSPYSFESADFIRTGSCRCVCGSDSIYYRIQNETVEIMTIIWRQDLAGI